MTDEMTATQRAFADALLECGAVKFGAFRLKLHEREPDAPLSPIYVDLRVLRSWPDAIDTAVAVLAEMISAQTIRIHPLRRYPDGRDATGRHPDAPDARANDYPTRGQDARHRGHDQRRFLAGRDGASHRRSGDARR